MKNSIDQKIDRMFAKNRENEKKCVDDALFIKQRREDNDKKKSRIV